MSRRLPALIAVLPLLAMLQAASAATPSSVLAGRALDGATFDLATDKGQVVIVNFWATWCAPCRAEMPALDAYYRGHKVDGLKVIAISVDAGASVKKLAAATSAYTFQVARLDDVKMARSAIPTALPVTRVYDRAGVLRYDSASVKGQPFLDQDALDQVVTPLLAASATIR